MESQKHCDSTHVCAELVPIFNHLDHESLVKISAITVHKQYRRGETVFSPEHSGRLLIVAAGRVKVYQLSASGKEQLLRVLEPGDFIGEENLFGAEKPDAWGEALADCELCTIGRENFIALLTQHPSISLRLLEEYSRRLSEAERLATRTATEPVLTRLALYLLELQKAQDDNTVTVPLSMRELAAFLGTTPETVSRRMRQLEEEGLIVREGKRIRIVSHTALKRYT